jgi:hypothetical protein
MKRRSDLTCNCHRFFNPLSAAGAALLRAAKKSRVPLRDAFKITPALRETNSNQRFQQPPIASPAPTYARISIEALESP